MYSLTAACRNMLRSDGRPHHGHTKEMLFLLTGQRVHAKDAASITTNFSRIASHCALSTDWLIFASSEKKLEGRPLRPLLRLIARWLDKRLRGDASFISYYMPSSLDNHINV